MSFMRDTYGEHWAIFLVITTVVILGVVGFMINGIESSNKSSGEAMCRHYEMRNCEESYEQGINYTCGQYTISPECNVGICCCYMGICD